MSGRFPFIAVYMMSSRPGGPLYTGVTADLNRRVYEHQSGIADGFTRKYNCKRLVWYEMHDLMGAAIQHEKRIKKYPRRWKVNLIEAINPDWRDLAETLWHN